MTDPTATPPTPPEQPTPPAPPLLPPAPPEVPDGTGELPPPSGPPIGVATPPPAPGSPDPRRSRTGLIVGLSFGGAAVLILLIVGVVAGALALSSLVSRQIESQAENQTDGGTPPFGAPDDPLEGDPGSPVAEDPLDCAECFDALDTRDVPLPEEAYRDLGLPDSDEAWGSGAVFREHRITVDDWRDADGSPDACFPVYSAAPLPPSIEPPLDDLDTVYYAPYHSSADGYSGITEAIRLFSSSDAAAEYLVAFDEALADCDQYSLPGSGFASRVSVAPALDVPDDVAAVAWVEVAGSSRYYAVDLLRGNLVVRIALWSDRNSITEDEFREFAEDYAAHLGEIPVR